MKHTILFPALALAVFATATVVAAEPAAKPGHGDRPTLDANGDGAIDRAEAAKLPQLADNFDALDKNHDGKLDAGERPARGHGHRGHRGHGGIERLDGDGDGRLSKAELEAGKAGRHGRANPLVEDFAAVDANKDGYLVRSEVRAWHEKQRPGREAEMRKRFDERFAAADLNRDGKLSRVEVDEKMPRLAKRFAWMDDNRDGFLSQQELRGPKGR